MLNIVWPIFIIISFSYAIFFGNLDLLNIEIFSSLENAINAINIVEPGIHKRLLEEYK